MKTKILKLLVTDFKKINLYGDCHAISDTEIMYPFRGRAIKVKILGCWFTYSYYTIK